MGDATGVSARVGHDGFVVLAQLVEDGQWWIEVRRQQTGSGVSAAGYLRSGTWIDRRHLDVACDQLALADRLRASGYRNNLLFTEPDFRWG